MNDVGVPHVGSLGGWSTWGVHCSTNWSVEVQTSTNGLLIEDNVSDLGV